MASVKRKSGTRSGDKPVGELDHIAVRGAAENNLKAVDVDLPKKRLVVITGVSGSGKSSLAFDTVFREGQRRYVESLSAYARQFLGQANRARFETIRGLGPTIAIEQKAGSKNPRSTVGTITEINDYLRVLYARVGVQYCHHCGKKVGRGHAESMVSQILEIPKGTRILVLAPIVENRKGEHREFFDQLRSEGFVRVRIDGVVRELSDVQALAKNKKHNIEVVVDRLSIQSDAAFKSRLTDSVETALKMGHGQLIVHVLDREDIRMSEARSCCGHAFPELDPPLFSFNSPHGMCVDCNGLGSVMSMDESKIIPDKSKSIREGAVLPWANFVSEDGEASGWNGHQIRAMEEQWKLDLDRPWRRLTKRQRNLILHGSEDKASELRVTWKGARSEGSWTTHYEGLIPQLMRRFRNTSSDSMKSYYGRFMTDQLCASCGGGRLRPEVVHVRIGGKSIADIVGMTIEEAYNFLGTLKLTGNQATIAKDVLREIRSRLQFLVNVGLAYLSLDRRGPTLSGGEAQRIRLASQVGSELTGVVYVLDEPSIGLHQRDNTRLLATLGHLRDIGNSLLIVEHDQETIEAADWVVDLGPGAGHLGGQIVACGTPAQLRRNKDSITGRYLSGRDEIPLPQQRRRRQRDHGLQIRGARANNLKELDVEIPLGLLTCVTGVSGAGKSTLINDILFPAAAQRLHNSTRDVGDHDTIVGLDLIDKVIEIDQRPIGRTPRSNPATYTKVFDHIRDLYGLLPESRARGYKKGRFSFNVKGGRCEQCSGDGYITVEMHFLSDVLVPCEVCQGRRFNDATLEVQFKSHSIADVLDLSVAQASELFQDIPSINRILQTLLDVGLGYLKLGQSATTMSGGEAQRIKLARELAKRDTGRTLYILDEPTTGLHFADVKRLLGVLQRLVDSGNTVLVIEHNLDVIKVADWVIDLGPEGGAAGGRIVGQGTPEALARLKRSHTGQFLKNLLG